MIFTASKIHFRDYWTHEGPFTPCGYKVVQNSHEARSWQMGWAKRYACKAYPPPILTMNEANTTTDPRQVTCMSCRNKLTLLGYRI